MSKSLFWRKLRIYILFSSSAYVLKRTHEAPTRRMNFHEMFKLVLAYKILARGLIRHFVTRGRCTLCTSHLYVFKGILIRVQRTKIPECRKIYNWMASAFVVIQCFGFFLVLSILQEEQKI